MLNLVYAAINPPIGRLSIYNWLVKGRERLPHGSTAASYNLVPDDLDVSFAAQALSAAPKAPDEYRVFILGDSAAWGALLDPSQTLAARLNDTDLTACGKHIQVYNLAYPTPSALKDFVILNKGLEYQPDLVVWLLTTNGLVVRRVPPIWGGLCRRLRCGLAR